MSIILDALRKSEAARRRHQAPELFAETHERAPAPRAQRRWPAWPLVSIAGLGVGALALAFWLMTRMATAPSTTDARSAASDAAAVDADSVAGSETLAPPLDTPADASNASATSPSTQTDQPSAVAQPPGAPATNIAPPVPPIAPAVAETIAETVATPSIAAPSKPATASVASQDTATIAAADESAPDPAFRSPVHDAAMALGDLDADTRKQLPPLKLSMHMWHDAPAQRFVILDGQRLREGDLIGDVVVQRITRDGATLFWRGTTLKIEWR